MFHGDEDYDYNNNEFLNTFLNDYYDVDDSFLFGSSFHRQLWNEDWIEAGCPPNRYPKYTNVDTSVGTWLSSYFVAIPAYAGIVLLMFQFCKSSESYRKRRPNLMQHLFFIGTAHLLGAIYHKVAIYTPENDRSNTTFKERYLQRFSYCLILFSIPGIINCLIPLFGNKPRYENTIGLFFCGFGIAMFLLDLKVAQLLTRLIQLIVSLLLFAVELRNVHNGKDRRECAVPWAAAMICTSIGTAIHLLFTKSCGSKEAYMNCFEDCLFGYKYNHTFFFHLFMVAAVILTILGGYHLPTGSGESDNNNNNNGGGNGGGGGGNKNANGSNSNRGGGK